MKSSIRTTFNDTARPLPFQMRNARWIEGEGDGETPPAENPPAEDPPADETPAEEEAPAEEPKTYDEAYVKRLKNENQSLRTRLREAEAALEAAKTEEDIEAAVSEFKNKNAELERNLLAVTVAARKGLPEGFAERLRGDTEADLEADADWYRQNGVGAGGEDDDGEPRGGLNPKRRATSAEQQADELLERVSGSGLRL